jgi:hypothetical protein
MRVIGIDAGSTGYVVQLDTDTMQAIYCAIPYRHDKLIDYDKLNRIFPELKVPVWIEKVRGRSVWGSSVCFKFGTNNGLIRAWLYNRNYHEVEPKNWQKLAHRGCEGDNPKVRSWLAFKKANPTSKICKSKDGLIDAYHIASWGLLQLTSKVYREWTFIKG